MESAITTCHHCKHSCLCRREDQYVYIAMATSKHCAVSWQRAAGVSKGEDDNPPLFARGGVKEAVDAEELSRSTPVCLDFGFCLILAVKQGQCGAPQTQRDSSLQCKQCPLVPSVCFPLFCHFSKPSFSRNDPRKIPSTHSTQ